MLDYSVNTQQSFLPQNCRTTFRAPVEERRRKHQPCFRSRMVTSCLLALNSPGSQRPSMWPTKHDRMATAALSRGSSRAGNPITVSPLCWHWPGVLNSYLFHCRGFSGKRASFAHKCWCDMKENFVPAHGHTAFLFCRNAQMRVKRWHKQTPVTQHRLEEMGHSAVQKPTPAIYPHHTHLLGHPKTRAVADFSSAVPHTLLFLLFWC